MFRFTLISLFAMIAVANTLPRPSRPEPHHNPEESYKTYAFGYRFEDEHGNRQLRQEHADGTGTVRGQFGYIDRHGQARIVNYIADYLGFRASIASNEPNTVSHSPAAVVFKQMPQHYKAQAIAEVESTPVEARDNYLPTVVEGRSSNVVQVQPLTIGNSVNVAENTVENSFGERLTAPRSSVARP